MSSHANDTHTPSTYLVIGAGGGIGRALARQLAADGATLYLAGRNPEGLDAISEETGGTAVVCDATDFEAVGALMERIKGEAGKLDGVAHLAGSLLLKPAHLTSEEEYRQTIETNLTSAFAVVRSSVKVMGSGGSIVLMSTAAARTGIANHEAIAAAKAGVTGLALSAAATYGPRGIRVNVVAPGLVETPLTARLVSNEASRKASESMHALGRLGQPEEVASAISWLLHPAQGWVTGQILGVDGGLATLRTKARA
mgnify:CR=1 FL=1